MISVITPSLNQAKYIGKTVESVLSQNFADLEYIIIDGGSTDGTDAVLKKYRGKLKYYAEKDEGQSQAINKGLKKARGEIISYLNSDDILEKDCLARVDLYFRNHPDISWVTGKCRIINHEGKTISPFIDKYKNFFLKHWRKPSALSILNFISQPSTFFRREVLAKAGFLDESLFYVMDYDYWLRLSKIYELGFIDEYLASFRIHQDSKSRKNFRGLFEEGYKAARKNNAGNFFLHRVHDYFSLSVYKFLY